MRAANWLAEDGQVGPGGGEVVVAAVCDTNAKSRATKREKYTNRNQLRLLALLPSVRPTPHPSHQAWAEVLALENSGTYNNQYMVTDLSRFEPGTALAPGLLWVVEQIPGLVESADATQMLAQGYWASYNVPAFPNVRGLGAWGW